jgi:hypothetical protein
VGIMRSLLLELGKDKKNPFIGIKMKHNREEDT